MIIRLSDFSTASGIWRLYRISFQPSWLQPMDFGDKQEIPESVEKVVALKRQVRI
jgi:hypothetical protein